jgi:hypothetical protein
VRSENPHRLDSLTFKQEKQKKRGRAHFTPGWHAVFVLLTEYERALTPNRILNTGGEKKKKVAMLFGNIISSPRDILSPIQALQLANVYLAGARQSNDPFLALVLCHDTEVSLSQAKRSSKGIDVHDAQRDCNSL